MPSNDILNFIQVIGGLTVITDTTTTAPTLNVAAGTVYRFTQPLTALTVASVEESFTSEAIIYFSTAAGAAPTISLPLSLGWINPPTFEVGKSYVLSILGSVATAGEVVTL